MANNKYKARKTKQQSPSVCKHANPGPTSANWYPNQPAPRPALTMLLQAQQPTPPELEYLPKIVTLLPLPAANTWQASFSFAPTTDGTATLIAREGQQQIDIDVTAAFQVGPQQNWHSTNPTPPNTPMAKPINALLQAVPQPADEPNLTAVVMRSL